MGRAKSNPAETRDFSETPQETRKPHPARGRIAIRINGLSHQDDLDVSLGHKLLDLADDVFARAISLRPPRKRNDAERAMTIAAFADSHTRAPGTFAQDVGGFHRFGVVLHAQVNGRFACLHSLLQKAGQYRTLLGACDYVYEGRPL